METTLRTSEHTAPTVWVAPAPSRPGPAVTPTNNAASLSRKLSDMLARPTSFRICKWKEVNCLHSFHAQYSAKEGVPDLPAPHLPLPAKDTDATHSEHTKPRLPTQPLVAQGGCVTALVTTAFNIGGLICTAPAKHTAPGVVQTCTETCYRHSKPRGSHGAN